MAMFEEYIEELTTLAAKNREAFIVEQLFAFVEKTDTGLVWNESVKLRLTEIEDYKQRVREAILNQIIQCRDDEQNCGAVLPYLDKLKEELKL